VRAATAVAFLLLDGVVAFHVWPDGSAGPSEAALAKDVPNAPPVPPAGSAGTVLAPVVDAFEVRSMGPNFAFLTWQVKSSGLVWSRVTCLGDALTSPFTSAVVGAGQKSVSLIGLLPGASARCRVVAYSEGGAASLPMHLTLRTEAFLA